MKRIILPILLIVITTLCLVFAKELQNTNQYCHQFRRYCMDAHCNCICFIDDTGLAFFYGGMVSKKNVISTMLQGFIIQHDEKL